MQLRINCLKKAA